MNAQQLDIFFLSTVVRSQIPPVGLCHLLGDSFTAYCCTPTHPIETQYIIVEDTFYYYPEICTKKSCNGSETGQANIRCARVHSWEHRKKRVDRNIARLILSSINNYGLVKIPRLNTRNPGENDECSSSSSYMYYYLIWIYRSTRAASSTQHHDQQHQKQQRQPVSADDDVIIHIYIYIRSKEIG